MGHPHVVEEDLGIVADGRILCSGSDQALRITLDENRGRRRLRHGHEQLGG
jgi:hypothetical protein